MTKDGNQMSIRGLEAINRVYEVVGFNCVEKGNVCVCYRLKACFNYCKFKGPSWIRVWEVFTVWLLLPQTQPRNSGFDLISVLRYRVLSRCTEYHVWIRCGDITAQWCLLETLIGTKRASSIYSYPYSVHIHMSNGICYSIKDER